MKKDQPEKHDKKPTTKPKPKSTNQQDSTDRPHVAKSSPVQPDAVPDHSMAVPTPPPTPPVPAPAAQAYTPHATTYVAPPQQRSGMPVWGIILIIVGVLLTLGILAIVGIAMMAFAAANQFSHMQKSMSNSSSQSTSETATYSTPRASFSYPSAWTKQDMDPTKIINANGSTVYKAAHFTSGTTIAADYREYGSGSVPSTTYYDHTKRVEGMNTAVKNINSMTANTGIGMTESYGLGCVKDFVVTTPAKLVDRDSLVGVTFDYTCIGIKGEKTKNTRMQWYDDYGTINLLTVSATDTSWAVNADAIAAIFESIEAY